MREPDFIIGDPANPYMLRWYLIPRNRWLNVYLHKFLRDDDDRAKHDHPWVSFSVVLSGGYYELTDGPDWTNQRRWYGVGSMIFRWATYRHRIELRRSETELEPIPPEKAAPLINVYQRRRLPCWTLFITGPRVREWGFWCPRGFVHWKEFCEPAAPGQVGRGCGDVP